MASTATSPKVITDYFPPSPKQEQSVEEETSSTKSELLPETENVLSTEIAVSDLSNSSVVITPQSTPEKDAKSSDKQEEVVEKPDVADKSAEQQKIAENPTEKLTNEAAENTTEELKNEADSKRTRKPACKKALSVELKTDSNTELPPKSKRKGRRKKAESSKSEVPSTEESKTPTKPKTARKKTPELKNHLVTDFFAVRRSDRRCKTDVETEKLKDLHYKILNGVEDGLTVEDIPNKGRGVVASKPFMRGDFVVQYVGDLIDMTEAKKRDTKYSKDPLKGCYMYYFNFKNKKYCIDATEESGKLGRLLNHSKTAGNCHTKLVDVNSSPYLILVASRDIEAGEELQYDYGDRSKASLESHPWLKA